MGVGQEWWRSTVIERSPSALVREARAAYEAGLFVACLTLLVTIPDVCAHLECGEEGKPVGERYRSWCEAYLDLDEGMPCDEINRSTEQARDEIGRTLERQARGPAFSSSDFYQLRNAVLHTESSKVDGGSAKYCQYHSIGVYVMDSDESLLRGFGATSRRTEEGVEKDCHFEVTVNLSGLLTRMERGVERFLRDNPDSDAEYGKAEVLRWGIVDVRANRPS